MISTIVYVSGALSDVPDMIRLQYLSFYEAIAERVKSIGLDPYVPHQNTDPIKHKDVTPKQVDFIDRSAVTSAWLVVAVADNPSLGVGIEVEMACHAQKSVILLCSAERVAARRISRLIRGNPSIVHEIVYSDFADALEQLETSIRSLLAEQEKSILPASLTLSSSLSTAVAK